MNYSEFLTILTLRKVREIFRRKEYAFFERGDYNLNIIFARLDDVFDNRFSDALLVYWKEGEKQRGLVVPATTLAGTKGFGGEQNPLAAAQTGTGVDGTAVVVEGQYRGAFKFVDSADYRTLWLSYPYLQQIKPMLYYRDNDRNGFVTRNSVLYTGLYHTHIHRMSNNGVDSEFVNSDFVPWSQGCLGATEPNFRRIVPLLRESTKRYGDIFSVTILHGRDFV